MNSSVLRFTNIRHHSLLPLLSLTVFQDEVPDEFIIMFGRTKQHGIPQHIDKLGKTVEESSLKKWLRCFQMKPFPGPSVSPLSLFPHQPVIVKLHQSGPVAGNSDTLHRYITLHCYISLSAVIRIMVRRRRRICAAATGRCRQTQCDFSISFFFFKFHFL